MAFLSKKVPKIFPFSKAKKGREDLMASNHCNHKGKGIPLFRKIVRENQQQEVEEEKVLRTPVTHYHHHQQQQQPQTPVTDTADCHNNNNMYSGSGGDGHNSSASTIDSSPIQTPREPMDRPTLLVLPDLFEPNVPSHQEGQTKSIENNIIPFSPRLSPRQADRPPPVAHVSVPAEFSFLPPPSEGLDSSPNRILRPPPREGEWDDATIESRILQDNNDDNNNNNNNNNDANDDDDGDGDDPEAAETETETELDQARKLRTQSQHEQQLQQQQLQREKAAAQASAIMKPWIERATRLALLQNRVCGSLQETNASGTRTPVPQQKHDRSNNNNSSGSGSSSSTQRIGNGAPLLFQRQRKTALAVNFRPRTEGGLYHNRALLASLEKGRDPKTKTNTASIEAGAAVLFHANAKTQQEQQQERSAPRIVKWHMVR